MRNQVDVDFKKNSHTRGASISLYTCSLCCISCKSVKERQQNPVFSQLSTVSVTTIQWNIY